MHGYEFFCRFYASKVIVHDDCILYEFSSRNYNFRQFSPDRMCGTREKSDTACLSEYQRGEYLMIIVQVISVIAISALLIYMLFKGWNPIIAPLIAACLVLLFNGSNIISGLADLYISGFNQMITG